MKPCTISAAYLSPEQVARVVRWLKANGVRHYIGIEERITVTGNRIIVRTLDVGRTYHPAYGRSDINGELPTKIRRYRIRVDLKDVE